MAKKTGPVLRPAIGEDQLPSGLSHLTRFRLAVAAGFEGVEMRSTRRSEEVDEVREAAAAAGRFSWSLIGEGGIDWSAVSEALAEADFCGWATNTGIPRRFFTGQIERGARLVMRLGIGEWPVIGHATRFVQQVAGARSLRRVAHQFERFRAGDLAHQ